MKFNRDSVRDEMATELGVRQRVPFAEMHENLSVRMRHASSLPGASRSGGWDVSTDDFAAWGDTWHVFRDEAAARALAVAQAKWQLGRLDRTLFWTQWSAERGAANDPNVLIIDSLRRMASSEHPHPTAIEIGKLAKRLVERYGPATVTSLNVVTDSWLTPVPAHETPSGLYYWKRQ